MLDPGYRSGDRDIESRAQSGVELCPYLSPTFHYCHLGQAELPTDGTEKRHSLALRLDESQGET